MPIVNSWPPALLPLPRDSVVLHVATPVLSSPAFARPICRFVQTASGALPLSRLTNVMVALRMSPAYVSGLGADCVGSAAVMSCTAADSVTFAELLFTDGVQNSVFALYVARASSRVTVSVDGPPVESAKFAFVLVNDAVMPCGPGAFVITEESVATPSESMLAEPTEDPSTKNSTEPVSTSNPMAAGVTVAVSVAGSLYWTLVAETETLVGAFAIENVRTTSSAAFQSSLPACDAVTSQEPAPVRCTLPLTIVHAPDAAYATARPEDAVAPGAKSASPYVLPAIDGNVIVWAPLLMVNDC